jgi:hypothetical protein
VVWEHEHGYRSQFVKVDSLIQFSEDWAKSFFPGDWSQFGEKVYAQYVGRVHEQAALFDVPVVQHG